jgi:transketolase
VAKATRAAFGESLAKLGEQHKEIVVLDADLSKSTMTMHFAKKFPERFFDMGIAEANMIGTASGLAFSGKIAFAASFGAFITGRYDTIRLSAVYADANVRLVGTHAGVGIGDDGHSQMGLEDVALMRALPNMGVFQPMDARETELVMDYLVKKWKGPAYLRLTRQALPDLMPAGAKWDPTKLMQIRKPFGPTPQALIIATGATVTEAVQAAETLEKQKISTSVWNAHCLKPFDEEGLRTIARDAKLVVTVEDHSVVGGLGTCVAEALAKATSHPALMKLGIQDTFGESGEPVELYDLHGLSAKKIAEKVALRLAKEIPGGNR